MLVKNLNSLHNLIYAITDVNLEYERGYNNRENIQQIRIIPKSGSFEETIIILLNNPEVRSIIASSLIGLFFYLLNKRDDNKNEAKFKAYIEELIVRNQTENIKGLYSPLEKQKDTLKLIENNEIKLEIDFNQKKQIDAAIDVIKEEIELEESIEEFEGYISAINFDTKNLKFHSKGMEHAYPLSYDVPLSSLIQIFTKPIKAKMKVIRLKQKIRRFHLIDYRILQSSLS